LNDDGGTLGWGHFLLPAPRIPILLQVVKHNLEEPLIIVLMHAHSATAKAAGWRRTVHGAMSRAEGEEEEEEEEEEEGGARV
jgi:ribosomal protein L12E/L44/L45/RPP1/RPP2